jgi:hypothetical protein
MLLLARGKVEKADLENDAEISIDDYDTVIFPAHNEGFHETFLGEDAWDSVRIQEDRIPKIKYVTIVAALQHHFVYSSLVHFLKYKSNMHMDLNRFFVVSIILKTMALVLAL